MARFMTESVKAFMHNCNGHCAIDRTAARIRLSLQQIG
jgi:hypothetical protein